MIQSLVLISPLLISASPSANCPWKSTEEKASDPEAARPRSKKRCFALSERNALRSKEGIGAVLHREAERAGYVLAAGRPQRMARLQLQVQARPSPRQRAAELEGVEDGAEVDVARRGLDHAAAVEALFRDLDLARQRSAIGRGVADLEACPSLVDACGGREVAHAEAAERRRLRRKPEIEPELVQELRVDCRRQVLARLRQRREGPEKRGDVELVEGERAGHDREIGLGQLHVQDADAAVVVDVDDQVVEIYPVPLRRQVGVDAQLADRLSRPDVGADPLPGPSARTSSAGSACP